MLTFKEPFSCVHGVRMFVSVGQYRDGTHGEVYRGQPLLSVLLPCLRQSLLLFTTVYVRLASQPMAFWGFSCLNAHLALFWDNRHAAAPILN